MKTLLPILLILFPPLLYGIHKDSVKTNRPTVEAIRSTDVIKINGILDESVWQRPAVSDFTQRDPIEGAKPTFPTLVWVTYDDEAIYVAARMIDEKPDSITSRIGRRDADLSSDWFGFVIDSYHDRRTGFYFAITPGGSIIDGTFFNDSWDDDSWDGVWDAATTIDSNGWTAEFKIPFSQLRFPELSEYVWGINFIRNIERYKEEDYFIMVPKNESGFVSHFADLIGITNIKPPPRIEFLPYLMGGLKSTNQFLAGDPFNDGNTSRGNIGVDMRFGIGNNLTLNAAVNPDFGQVEVDPAVVNLTQFETYFEEKRPFFVDGSDYFNFGWGGASSNYGFNFGSPTFLYSRRIGRYPEGSIQHEGYIDFPDATTILAAGKLTGKITEGWSIGSIHAFTQRESAIIDSSGVRYKDVVEPFASYNVIRSLREFNNGRQALGFIGTAMMRESSDPFVSKYFNKSAYSIGMDGWFPLNKERDYVLTGWIAGSHVTGTKDRLIRLQRSPMHYFQRPDAKSVEVDSQATSMTGYAGRFTVNKERGNFIFNTAIGFISPDFDVNDAGFMYKTNIINGHVVVGYKSYEPDGTFRTKNIRIATYRSHDFDGYKIDQGYMLWYNLTFMNYWEINGQIHYTPHRFDNNLTRGGPAVEVLPSYNVEVGMETDFRKPVGMEFGISAFRNESGSYGFGTEFHLEWKPYSNFSISMSPEFQKIHTSAQWMPTKNSIIDTTLESTYGVRYIFSVFDRTELSAGIRLNWTFTPKLSLQVYMQPLISVGNYYTFKELAKARAYKFNTYGVNGSSIEYDSNEDKYIVDPDGTGERNFEFSNPDFNFKSLRLNAVLRWEFLPGSTLYLVWTRNGTAESNLENFSFNRDIKDVVDPTDFEDVFLLKIAYWLHL